MPVAGDLLLGRYRVLEVRAGWLRAADDTGAHVTGLVGVLPAGVAGDPESLLSDVDRYRIGADAILRWVGSSALGGELAVAWEERSSRTLATLMSEGKLRADRVASIVAPIGRALAALHDQGIAHGHLRPECVQVADDGRVYLMGFGFCHVLSRMANARAAAEAVPLAYRAPELNASAPAADVFALGVLVRELLGGDCSNEVESRLGRFTHESPGQRPDDIERATRELAEALVEQSAAPVPMPSPFIAPTPALEPLAAIAPPTPEPAASPPDVPAPIPEPTVPSADAPEVSAPPPIAEAPPRAFPRPQQEIAPPFPSATKSETSWAPILAVLGGVLLMVAGTGALFAYAMLRSPATATAPVATVTVVPAPPPPVPAADGGVEEQNDAGLAGTDGGIGDIPFEIPGDGGAPSIRFATVDDGEGPLPVTPDAAIWGDKGALVTIVWFGDLECPHTRNAYRVIEAVQRAFTGEVRVVWRHRPLSIHPHAKDAARVLAGIRRELGDAAFWRFVAAVSGDARDADRTRLEQWAERAGAEPIRVTAWLASRDTESEVARDLELAGTFDVRATPTFFVNGVRVDGTRSYDDMKSVVQKELAASRGLAALGNQKGIYAARVRKNLTGQGTDVAARTCPPIGSSPVRGATDALVTIVEFSDFECQFCKVAQPTLETLLTRFGGDARLVWKNFPLSMHPRALPAANFALEARAKGGDTSFWKVHDLLFADQKNLDDEGLESVAKRAGLDGEKMLEAVQRSAHKATIAADMEQGKRLGVRGTPSFFVNGRQVAGALPLEKFQAVVQEELDVARRLVKSGTPRSRVYDAVCGAR